MPMVLIGNGTGIAGLRALLREAELAGVHGHWLLFGERHAAHDRLFADELQVWQASGHLQQLEWVFSRDQPQKNATCSITCATPATRCDTGSTEVR